jgi:hypothetical protein
VEQLGGGLLSEERSDTGALVRLAKIKAGEWLRR